MRALAILVFVVGAGSLGAEIAAARLLAPYFGDSTIIWANTIGVCLIALAIGHYMGGRWADRHPHLQGLKVLVLLSAGLLSIVPLVSGPFLDLAITAFDKIEAGAFVGSLLGMLVLIALPLVLIGAATPWATKLAVTDLDKTGETVGRLGAIGTAGSLVGTFAASLLLIPFVGSQRTFIVLALLMAIAGAWRMPARAWVVPVVVGLLLLIPPGTTKPAEKGDTVVDEAETLYQYARVVQHPIDDGVARSGPAPVERRLELNEGQAIHSIWRADTVLTDNYWDAFQVLPFAVDATGGKDGTAGGGTAGGGRAGGSTNGGETTGSDTNGGGTVGSGKIGSGPSTSGDAAEIPRTGTESIVVTQADGTRTSGLATPGATPRTIAMLGNAGGTVARASLKLFPQVRFDGVEIDSKVSEMGRKWLGMPDDPRLEIYSQDARPFLRSSGLDDGKGRYDLIGVDAYRQPYIPFYLTTREFFREVRTRLTSRGSVIVNVGHPEGDTALEKALSSTMRTDFPHVARYAMTPTNTLVIASTADISADRLRAAIPTMPAALRDTAQRAAENLQDGLAGGPVYTDDKAPVEWLIDGSIVSFATK
ncbi:spermidine synthase [Patulibacter minatonensis]|uniref:spermidine synthase n=1 Tax=Patulibacter minatonensis TaxID=298163 RepID=UPI0006884B6F|nr:fused MFS/spermidine synthase [Patulibacter minatonensis]